MTGRSRPNILHILSDQHSPFVTGCYGDPVVATPALDALAADGAVFDAAYCPSPICVPSRMAMLTGRHPSEIGVWTNDHILDSQVPTFAHSLGAAGYRTVVVGRLHSLGPDQLRGYQERLVGEHSSNHVGVAPVDRGPLTWAAGPDVRSIERSGPGQSAYEVHDEDVIDAATARIEAFADDQRSGADGRPFAMTIGLMLPHQPYVARRADYERYAGRVPAPRLPAPDDEHPYLAWWRSATGLGAETPSDIERARVAYWALVDRMDVLIGRLTGTLERLGLGEDTLVVYLSDHGEQIGERGLWWKQTFYEQSARIPVILSWPGRIPAGTRIDRPIDALDVTATMLDAAEAPPLPDQDGRSLLPLLAGTGEARAAVFSEYCTDDGWIVRMVRRDRWKYVHYDGHDPQLFDLEHDPDEHHDLGRDPRFVEIRTELRALVLERWHPEAIREAMRLKREQVATLAAWASATPPEERHVWSLRTEMNQLESP